MNNYCAFSIDHKCIKWIDYEIPRQELVEADELCHGNWIEIEKKNIKEGKTKKKKKKTYNEEEIDELQIKGINS